jgi:hypothetical protein
MRNMKRSVTAAAAAVLTLSNFAMAQEPLAPGKPAGVKHAQTVETDTLLEGLGLAAVAIGITVGLSSGSGSSGSGVSVSTSTTS